MLYAFYIYNYNYAYDCTYIILSLRACMFICLVFVCGIQYNEQRVRKRRHETSCPGIDKIVGESSRLAQGRKSV